MEKSGRTCGGRWDDAPEADARDEAARAGRRSAVAERSGNSAGGSVRTRMRVAVFLDDVLALHVRVYLRCGDVGMSEHILDRTQIGAAFEQVGCERMT